MGNVESDQTNLTFISTIGSFNDVLSNLNKEHSDVLEKMKKKKEKDEKKKEKKSKKEKEKKQLRLCKICGERPAATGGGAMMR